MLRIRLQRSGRKGRANYKIVVAEHSAPIQGRYAALLGTYDPLVEKHGFKIDTELLSVWIKKGAKPTNTVARLLKGQGVPDMERFIVEMKNKTVKNPKEKPAEVPAPAAPAEVAPEPAEPAAPAEVPPSDEKAPDEKAPDEKAPDEKAPEAS